MRDEPGYRPTSWLRELARLHPADFPVSTSIRAAFCVAGPLFLGLATGHFEAALWVTLATLTLAAGEGTGSYASRLRQIAIATPIAVLGFLAGYLTILPYPAIVVIMAVLAFFSGILSSFGAPYSNGAMQALLFACIMIGLPEAGPPLLPLLLYLLGVVFYVCVLAGVAQVDPRRPERNMLQRLFTAMAALAQACALAPTPENETPAIEAARRKTTDASMVLHATLLEFREYGQTRESERLAAILDAADVAFSSILAERNPKALSAAAEWLQSAANDFADKGKLTKSPPDTQEGHRLDSSLADLAAALRNVEVTEFSISKGGAKGSGRLAMARLQTDIIVERSVLRDAAALGLCMGFAFSAKYVVQGNHWYWVPMTVAIVMKPDLGSIFVRTVHRAIGTSLGVVIGATLLAVLPKGPWLIIGVSLLAGLLPWAKLLSYAAYSLALTPLVLVILDLISRSSDIVDFGAQRLADTVIGGAIVLFFGYFLWPRHQLDRIASKFGGAMTLLADYLLIICDPSHDKPAAPVERRTGRADARRAAYGALSNLRVALARAAAEPPPAGREAAIWRPIIADAERICDRITAFAATSSALSLPPIGEVAKVVDQIRTIPEAIYPTEQTRPENGTISDPFLKSIASDASHLADRIERDILAISGNSPDPSHVRPAWLSTASR